MKLRTLLPCLIALLLTGCMTAQERRAADEAKCRSYGFERRNDAFAECLQRIDLARRAALRRDSDFDDLSPPLILYRPVIVPQP